MTTDFATNSDAIHGLALQVDGRIVAGGGYSSVGGSGFALTRYRDPSVLDERIYVQQDANWNVTALVDVTGTVVERYIYDPYGGVTILTGSWDSRANTSYSWVYLHQGGRYDWNTGLYQFRYREYSPEENSVDFFA